MKRLALLLLFSGCSGLLDLPRWRLDAGSDAGSDAGGRPDSGTDAGPDAAPDAGGCACESCAVEPCFTECGTAGTAACAADCSGPGACVPPAENCGVEGDDNCDGVPDEADPCCERPLNYRCDDAEILPAAGGVFEGCTQSADDEQQDGCAPTLGPDVFYALSLLELSDVTVSLEGSEFDTVLYVRLDCDDPLTTVACGDDVEMEGACPFETRTSVLVLRGLAPETYFIVVDAPDPSAFGRFRLRVDVAPAGG